MSSQDLDNAILGVQDALAAEDTTNEEFETALQNVARIPDPEVPELMLLLLSDSYDLQDWMMRAILYEVEKFGRDIYVAAFLNVIVQLHAKSPDWIETIMMRMLNSDECVRLISLHSKTSDNDQNNVINMICSKIAFENPNQFRRSADIVMSHWT